jgi:hypothetical protein
MWKVFKEHRRQGVGIGPARVYYLATSIYAKAFVTYIPVTVPATNVLIANVFGTGIFH